MDAEESKFQARWLPEVLRGSLLLQSHNEVGHCMSKHDSHTNGKTSPASTTFHSHLIRPVTSLLKGTSNFPLVRGTLMGKSLYWNLAEGTTAKAQGWQLLWMPCMVPLCSCRYVGETLYRRVAGQDYKSTGLELWCFWSAEWGVRIPCSTCILEIKLNHSSGLEFNSWTGTAIFLFKWARRKCNFVVKLVRITGTYKSGRPTSL